MSRRLTVVTMMLAFVLAACGGPTETTPTTAADPDRDASAAVMAAALERLVTRDHTFGQGPPPFTQYLIQTHTDPSAGGPERQEPSRPLTESERQAIEAVVEPFAPVLWIDDPDEWRTEDLRPTIEGAVILGVGEPRIDGDTALAPVSLWCGGVCGTWLTYRVERVGGAWGVTGVEGPIAIS